MQGPGRRIAYGYTGQGYILTVVDKEQSGAEYFSVLASPPVLLGSVSVDGSLSVNHNILRIYAADDAAVNI